MALFRRGRSAEPEPVSLTDALGVTFGEDVDSLAARVSALEARAADAAEAAIVLPDQTDVLDADVRAAKLAAELHLVTLELKSELRRLTTLVDTGRAGDLADQLIDLSGELTDRAD